jgi:integrase
MALADVDPEKSQPQSSLIRIDAACCALLLGSGPHGRFGPLSHFLDWCHDAGHITVNPCNQIARSRSPKTPQAREHYLTVAQLARLWHVAERLGETVWRDLNRLFTGVPSRRGEVARLQWPPLDFTATEWRMPGRMTKNGEAHRLHVHPLVMEILERRWRRPPSRTPMADPQKFPRNVAAGPPGSGLVFPAPSSGRPVDTFSDIQASFIEARKSHDGALGAELAGWIWHDLRRSFAAALGEAGISEVVADVVLNHRQAATRSGVLGVY